MAELPTVARFFVSVNSKYLRKEYTSMDETLNHCRRDRKGQIVLEYLLVGAVMTLATVLAFQSFSTSVRGALEDVFNGAARKIAR